MIARPKQAEARPAPRLYLLTPPIADAPAFVPSLVATLAASDVAAVLLRLTDADERTLINRAKAIAPLVQDKGAALLIEVCVDLVVRAGADGVHVRGMTAFDEAIERLKPERIVGVGGLATRHDSMVAAEAGADYLMFGEPDERGVRPAFEAIEERIVWWAELFEIPCIGYAASIGEIAPLVTAGADFVALGDWLWRDAPGVIKRVAEQLRLPERAA